MNGYLAILKNLKCLQLKKELNNRKDRHGVKMSHYVMFNKRAGVLYQV